ncbi:hypothetical protein, partial [Turicimonas muris]|uniref:hypothetical protein n=1 Tax=Turicimonas muris TaxID=1796652 RepID=UPI0025B69C3F
GSPVRVRPQAPCPRSGMGPPSGFGLELWTVWIGTDNAANKPNLAWRGSARNQGPSLVKRRCAGWRHIY